MAAYMRKTGILPVCTNNEARAYFAGKGLTYADVTEGDILALVMLLNKHIKKANKDCETSMGSILKNKFHFERACIPMNARNSKSSNAQFNAHGTG